MKTRLSLPALAASAICGLTLCALRLTLSYLFGDVEEKTAEAQDAEKEPAAAAKTTAEAKPSFAR
ncbi:MAG: hypothetical protein IJH91_00095 [Mogibacterium sp.]|nr:hypothetical protein [Mogibacterium sp.]